MHPTAEGDALRAAREKERRLVAWLEAQPSVLVAFSGGVDSAYLGCVAAKALGPERVLAIIGRSPSYPAAQWAAARDVADRFGLPVLEVDTHEMSDPRYAANPTNRCYFCKTELWDRLLPVARARGAAVVVDGTNADDLTDYRPGAQAARERGVRSPLADAGLTKAEIRLLSRERGIPTWSQPSSPCLSSRLPYGLAVTPERLRQVEEAERAMRSLGAAGDLRVRHHGDLARVELARDAISAWLEPGRLASLHSAMLGAGFSRAALDLRGFRSGGLNVLAGVVPSVGTGSWELGTGVVSEPPVPSSQFPAPTMNDALRDAFGALGIAAAVELRSGFAILVADDAAPLRDGEVRAAVLSAASERGVRTVAMEARSNAQRSAARAGGRAAVRRA